MSDNNDPSQGRSRSQQSTSKSDDDKAKLVGGALTSKAKSSPTPSSLNASLADRLRERAPDTSAEKEKLNSLFKQIKERGEQAIKNAQPLDAEAQQKVSSQIADIKRRFDTLIRDVKLTDISNQIASLGAKTKKLPNDIQDIRSKGYAFKSYLENKSEVLQDQWNQIDENIRLWIEQESADLKGDLDEAESMVKKLTNTEALTTVHEKVANELQPIIETLEKKVNSSEQYARGLYDALSREINQTSSELSKIKWALEKTNEAKFDRHPTEAVYMVAEAEWDDGKDKPDGFLFLTDQRLIFEQNEKTGKKLGLFGGKQTQEVLWESPINSVEEVTPENKGLLGSKDLIHLKFSSGAQYRDVTVEVKDDKAKIWAQHINRIKSGNVSNERAIEPDPELIKKLREAPAECPVCGGTLGQLYAGQVSIDCEYCGTSIKI